jgi:hypothetical protein
MAEAHDPLTYILGHIDEEGSPEFMTKLEWMDFLLSVIDSCHSRLAAVLEELEDEEEGDDD